MSTGYGRMFPLPSDIRPKKAEALDTNSSFYTVCPNCNTGLMIPPNGFNYSLRQHKRAVECRRATEIIRMNKKGLFELGGKHVTKRSRWLIPYVTKGKFAEFFPETIVSFLRWKLGLGVPSIASEAVQSFLQLSPEAQAAHLSGIILAREYANEDRSSGIEQEEPPF